MEANPKVGNLSLQDLGQPLLLLCRLLLHSLPLPGWAGAPVHTHTHLPICLSIYREKETHTHIINIYTHTHAQSNPVEVHGAALAVKEKNPCGGPGGSTGSQGKEPLWQIYRNVIKKISFLLFFLNKLIQSNFPALFTQRTSISLSSWTDQAQQQHHHHHQLHADLIFSPRKAAMAGPNVLCRLWFKVGELM